MRKFVAACAALLLAAGVCAAEEPALQTQKDKASYAIGRFLAKDIMSKGVDLNVDIFIKGFRDAMTGAKPILSDKEAQAAMDELNKELDVKRKAQSAKSATEEEKFLAENKQKPGVKTLPSGLQYKVLKEGAGPSPTLYDTVTVNYRGTLLNGSEFDSSYRRKRPSTFQVNGVIQGWSEALQLMSPGAKWQIFVPSKLAYEEMGIEGLIPPNATLIFEVELISISDSK
jgi:FKBP-type peptidyl-prolyl cis-trans isomerase FklB